MSCLGQMRQKEFNGRVAYTTCRISTGNRLRVKSGAWCNKNKNMREALDCYATHLSGFVAAFWSSN